MYQKVNSAILNGIDSLPVAVEADVTGGMPVFELVGFVSSEVREARERIRSAFSNSGFRLPPKRITVNISPADKKKHGTALDLPIAIALLMASELLGDIREGVVEETVIAGELGLNGDVRSINGVLPIVIAAREAGARRCMVPAENADEAALVSDMTIIAVSSLNEAVMYIKNGILPKREPKPKSIISAAQTEADFAYINGQALLKRACEVAAGGRHNMLLVGPPGAGKTLAARAISSIMPEMTLEEQLEVSKIYSVLGLLDAAKGLMRERPFRAPHHTTSTAAITGGGSIPRPGELSLAHEGVLFLDELTEFKRETIEVLRQPLEERKIRVSRVNAECTFPADIMLVGAMNPCPCGEYPDFSRCTCKESTVRAYQGKVSKPLRDRMDICISVPRVGYGELSDRRENEPSKSIRKRVEAAWRIQRERFSGTGISFNSRIPAKKLGEYCRLGEKEERYIREMYDKLSLTARGYHKLLRVARTIADLSNERDIGLSHLTEAVCYRDMDSSFAGEA